MLDGRGYEWKSDVWSLGCLLYELATLRSPFKSEGDNLYTLFKKISVRRLAQRPLRRARHSHSTHTRRTLVAHDAQRHCAHANAKYGILLRTRAPELSLPLATMASRYVKTARRHIPHVLHPDADVPATTVYATVCLVTYVAPCRLAGGNLSGVARLVLAGALQDGLVDDPGGWGRASVCMMAARNQAS